MNSFIMKAKYDLETIAVNAHKRGKTDKEIKLLISAYLIESKKKINQIEEIE